MPLDKPQGLNGATVVKKPRKQDRAEDIKLLLRRSHCNWLGCQLAGAEVVCKNSTEMIVRVIWAWW